MQLCEPSLCTSTVAPAHSLSRSLSPVIPAVRARDGAGRQPLHDGVPGRHARHAHGPAAGEKKGAGRGGYRAVREAAEAVRVAAAMGLPPGRSRAARVATGCTGDGAAIATAWMGWLWGIFWLREYIRLQWQCVLLWWQTCCAVCCDLMPCRTSPRANNRSPGSWWGRTVS